MQHHGDEADAKEHGGDHGDAPSKPVRQEDIPLMPSLLLPHLYLFLRFRMLVLLLSLWSRVRASLDQLLQLLSEPGCLGTIDNIVVHAESHAEVLSHLHMFMRCAAPSDDGR